MKLKRVTWSELRPAHKGSAMFLTEGSVEGIKVLFVMGNDGGWYAGPMFSFEGAPAWLRERADRRRPSLDAAKQAAREMMEAYLRLITTDE